MCTYHLDSFLRRYIFLSGNTDNGFDLFLRCCIVDFLCRDDIEFSVEWIFEKIPKNGEKKRIHCNYLHAKSMIIKSKCLKNKFK